MKIRILDSAICDLKDGREFYDLQELGVGDYFQDCLFADIDSLLLYGGMHRKIFGYHRLLSSRFPYAIYYRMDESETAVIFRVLDCRSDPSEMRRSLK